MPRERSAGAVIFRRENTAILYLLLHYKFKTEYWDFPRGNIEKGEKPEETVLRELKEETGIDLVKFVPGFSEKISWYYRRAGQTIFKEVAYFLVETTQKEVVISKEHLGYEWLAYEEAMQRTNLKNTKDVLEKAHNFLAKREKEGLGRFLQ